MARILFLIFMNIAPCSMIAMEKQVNRSKFVSKKITADASQQKGKGGKQQKVLTEKKEAEKKRQEEANRILEKKAQEIAAADEFNLVVEKENKPRYLIIDEEEQDILFEDRKISHSNPIKLIIELNKAVENKDKVMINRILSDRIFVQQIKAFRPYSGAITEDTKKFNENISYVQQWIAQKEQEAGTKKSQNPKTNTNG